MRSLTSYLMDGRGQPADGRRSTTPVQAIDLHDDAVEEHVTDAEWTEEATDEADDEVVDEPANDKFVAASADPSEARKIRKPFLCKHRTALAAIKRPLRRKRMPASRSRRNRSTAAAASCFRSPNHCATALHDRDIRR